MHSTGRNFHRPKRVENIWSKREEFLRILRFMCLFGCMMMIRCKCYYYPLAPFVRLSKPFATAQARRKRKKKKISMRRSKPKAWKIRLVLAISMHGHGRGNFPIVISRQIDGRVAGPWLRSASYFCNDLESFSDWCKQEHNVKPGSPSGTCLDFEMTD